MRAIFSCIISCLMLITCSLTGCVVVQPKQALYLKRDTESIPLFPTNSNNLLACIQETETLSKRERNMLLNELTEKTGPGNKFSSNDQLRYICLSFHELATKKQREEGIKYLCDFLYKHPHERNSLEGILLLAERIDHQTTHYTGQNKSLKNKNSALQKEKKSLEDQVSTLKKQNTVDKKRIDELEKQIEQLKNIENIIKNREL